MKRLQAIMNIVSCSLLPGSQRSRLTRESQQSQLHELILRSLTATQQYTHQRRRLVRVAGE